MIGYRGVERFLWLPLSGKGVRTLTEPKVLQQPLGRRRFLSAGLAAATITIGLPSLARAATAGHRSLSFYNLHTDEKLTTTYWVDGQYVPDALGEIDHVLRDFRTGDVWPMDRKLLDLLVALNRKMETAKPFAVISGYRSPKTNAMLAEASSGVARRSLHMDGKAIDIRIPGRKLADLRKAALSLKLGGVGYYARSDFVHVDTGRVRSW
jgi:uncharacterized protein YcbK (DUF882 family)